MNLIKDIAKKHILTETEVRGYISCYLEIPVDKYLSEEKTEQVQNRLAELETAIKTWRKTSIAARDLGISRQRFSILVKEHKLTPQKFGDRQTYWKTTDLRKLKKLIRDTGRPKAE